MSAYAQAERVGGRQRHRMYAVVRRHRGGRLAYTHAQGAVMGVPQARDHVRRGEGVIGRAAAVESVHAHDGGEVVRDTGAQEPAQLHGAARQAIQRRQVRERSQVRTIQLYTRPRQRAAVVRVGVGITARVGAWEGACLLCIDEVGAEARAVHQREGGGSSSAVRQHRQPPHHAVGRRLGRIHHYIDTERACVSVCECVCV
jgi:hypothetical protein